MTILNEVPRLLPHTVGDSNYLEWEVVEGPTLCNGCDGSGNVRAKVKIAHPGIQHQGLDGQLGLLTSELVVYLRG